MMKKDCEISCPPQETVIIQSPGWDYRVKGSKSKRSEPLPDGTYTQFTVKNGEFTAFGKVENKGYTPPVCENHAGTNPTPSAVVISPENDNIIENKPNGLYARSWIADGKGYTVAGVGTKSDPYKLNITLQGGGGGTPLNIKAGKAINVNASGNDVEISSDAVSLPDGSYNGIDVVGGKIIGIDIHSTIDATSILVDPPLIVENTVGGLKISIEPQMFEALVVDIINKHRNDPAP